MILLDKYIIIAFEKSIIVLNNSENNPSEKDCFK